MHGLTIATERNRSNTHLADDEAIMRTPDATALQRHPKVNEMNEMIDTRATRIAELGTDAVGILATAP